VAVCQERLRRSDILGRIGGGEFAIVLPRTNGDAAAKIGATSRSHIAHSGWPKPQPSMSASFGIASVLPRSSMDIEELLRRADTALYTAKNGGRNRCAVWVPPATTTPVNAMRRVLKARTIAFNRGKERFIGVIYRPDTELTSHYASASLAAVRCIRLFDETEAVIPIGVQHTKAGVPDTFPFGV
jgi:predicted signal transduction protein with EAL and GGDEF domain